MKALLFDLDGTLVDTIPLWIEANIRALKDLRYTMDSETFLHEFYQKGLHFRGILEQCGLDPKHGKSFYSQRDNLYVGLLKENVEWIGNAGEVLTKCAAKIPLGLMTGSRRSFIDALEPKLKLSRLFKTIITYDDTGERMKPNPYGLLLLTKKMIVEPQSCLYVGDQDVDAKAARAVGMMCCIIPRNETPKEAAIEADIVLKNIDDVVRIVEEEA